MNNGLLVMERSKNGQGLALTLCDECPCDKMEPIEPKIWFYYSYSSAQELQTRGGTAYNQLWKPMPSKDPATGQPIGWQPGHWEGTTWVTGYWAATNLQAYCNCPAGNVTEIAWWADEYLGYNGNYDAFNGNSWWLRCVWPAAEIPLGLENGPQRDFVIGMFTYAGFTSGAVKSGQLYYTNDRRGNLLGSRKYTFIDKDEPGIIPAKAQGTLEEGTPGLLTVNQECGETGQAPCEVKVAATEELDEEWYGPEVTEDVYAANNNLLYHTEYGRKALPKIYKGNCSAAVIAETEPHSIPQENMACIYRYEITHNECCGWLRNSLRRFETLCGDTGKYTFGVWVNDKSGCRATYNMLGAECRGNIACVFNQPTTLPDMPTIEPNAECIKEEECAITPHNNFCQPGLPGRLRFGCKHADIEEPLQVPGNRIRLRSCR
jgi:hypothetical protein